MLTRLIAGVIMIFLTSCSGVISLGSTSSAQPKTPEVNTTVLATSDATEVVPVSIPTSTPAPAHREILLSPNSGAINTSVRVTGLGFPTTVEIHIRLGVPGSGAFNYVYAQTTSDSSGSFNVAFTIPARWPDTREISGKTIVILAETNDSSVRAQADFHITASTALTLTTQNPVTGTLSIGDPSKLTDTKPVTGVVNPIQPTSLEPIAASIDFLNSLLRDPSGTSSVGYLSKRLRTEIASNWILPTGLGIQPGYNSFEVVMLSRDEGSVIIQATLTYESGASLRNFKMIQEGENWRIDDVTAGTPQ